jgi:hypothetical protein
VSIDRCPETYDGRHSLSDPDGRCRYCRVTFERPARMPEHVQVSELTSAYGEHYDPDWDGGAA